MSEQIEDLLPEAYVDSRSKSNSIQLAWGAVVAGAIMSLAYQVLLNLLGVGLELSSFNLNTTSLFKVGAMAIVWLTISGIISMGIGGWFSGKFCNIKCKFKRACHGLLAWGLATLVSIMVTASGAGAFLGGVISITENSVTAISQSSELKQEARANIYPQLKEAEINNSKLNATTAKVHDTTNSLGKAAIVLFIAFLLSAVGSV